MEALSTALCISLGYYRLFYFAGQDSFLLPLSPVVLPTTTYSLDKPYTWDFVKLWALHLYYLNVTQI
jgi:hypothetical protein